MTLSLLSVTLSVYRSWISSTFERVNRDHMQHRSCHIVSVGRAKGLASFILVRVAVMEETMVEAISSLEWKVEGTDGKAKTVGVW